MKFIQYFIFVCSLAFVLPAFSQADVAVFEKSVERLSSMRDSSIGDLATSAALLFLDKPYVGGTLDGSEKEKLVVNLREFDCMTLVENSIAIAKAMKLGDASFEEYENILRGIRYRGGIVDGYSSRLHYTSDWVFENSKSGGFTNITQDLGGRKIAKRINFMSTHRNQYKQLVTNDDNLRKIEFIEDSINQRDEGIDLIPIVQILNIESKLNDGDIVIFGTKTRGLDYSHIGIIHRIGAKLTFIHASSLNKKVVVESKGLYEYCRQSKNCSGITILRLN